MPRYYVNVISQDNKHQFILNANDKDDISRQAYKFVNENPDRSMIGIEGDKIFVILRTSTPVYTNHIGVIGDGRLCVNDYVQHTWSNNLYNNDQANNLYNNGHQALSNNTLTIDQRIVLRNITLNIAREHTRKYGDSCKFGRNCKFICKYKHCKRKDCVYHHFY